MTHTPSPPAYRSKSAKRITDPITGNAADFDNVTGIQCPRCNATQSRVTNSRPGVFSSLGSVHRRRRCHSCNLMWGTYEISEQSVHILLANLAGSIPLEILLKAALDKATSK